MYPPSMDEMGTYCWKNSIDRFRHPTKVALIFKTDRFIEKRGFKVAFNIDKCGGIVNTSTVITSIRLNNSTEGYPSDVRCLWNITAPQNQNIIIRFEEFDLEPNDQCLLDSVDVYRGYRSLKQSRLIRLCGNITNLISPVNVQSNKALVEFRSDSSVSGKGFRALVLFYNYCDETIVLNATNPTYTLRRNNGNLYDNNLLCQYKISAPEGSIIKLKFNIFHIAPCSAQNTSCLCDYLEVRDGAGSYAELLGK